VQIPVLVGALDRPAFDRTQLCLFCLILCDKKFQVVLCFLTSDPGDATAWLGSNREIILALEKLSQIKTLWNFVFYKQHLSFYISKPVFTNMQ